MTTSTFKKDLSVSIYELKHFYYARYLRNCSQFFIHLRREKKENVEGKNIESAINATSVHSIHV